MNKYILWDEWNDEYETFETINDAKDWIKSSTNGQEKHVIEKYMKDLTLAKIENVSSVSFVNGNIEFKKVSGE